MRKISVILAVRSQLVDSLGFKKQSKIVQKTRSILSPHINADPQNAQITQAMMALRNAWKSEFLYFLSRSGFQFILVLIARKGSCFSYFITEQHFFSGKIEIFNLKYMGEKILLLSVIQDQILRMKLHGFQWNSWIDHDINIIYFQSLSTIQEETEAKQSGIVFIGLTKGHSRKQ